MSEHLGLCAGAQRPGTISDISTDELLARRAQRQQAERRAHMASKGTNSFVRRPMAPVQPRIYQRPAQASKADMASATAAANPSSRASKRPLGNPSSLPGAAAPAGEPAGVSADELAKLLDDTAGDVDSPAKRLKLSDLAPVQQQQAAADSIPMLPLRACLLTHKVLDPITTIAAACERVAEQRREQEATVQAAAKAAAEAAAAKAAAEAAFRARAAEEAAALAGKRVQMTHQEGSAAATQRHAPRWRFEGLQQAEQKLEKQHQQHVKGSGTTTRKPLEDSVDAPVTAAAGTSRRRKVPDSVQPAVYAAHGGDDNLQQGHDGKKAIGRPSSSSGKVRACTAKAAVKGQHRGKERLAAAVVAVAKACDATASHAASRRRSQRGQKANTEPHVSSKTASPLVHAPMQHLSAVTLKAPSRRVRELHSAAAKASEATAAAAAAAVHCSGHAQQIEKAKAHSIDTRPGQCLGGQAHAQKQQQHAAVPLQGSIAVACQQQQVALPSPLTRKTSPAAAGCGDATMVLLDSDDDVEAQLSVELTTASDPGRSTAPVLAADEAAAWFAARVAAAAAPVTAPAAEAGRPQQAQPAADVSELPAPQQSHARQQQTRRRTASKHHSTGKDAGGQDNKRSLRSGDDKSTVAAAVGGEGTSTCSDAAGSEDDAGAGSSSSDWEESDETDMSLDTCSSGDEENDELEPTKHDSMGKAAAAGGNRKLTRGRGSSELPATAVKGPTSRAASVGRRPQAVGAASESDGEQQAPEGEDDDAAAAGKKRSRKTAAGDGAVRGAAKKKTTAAAKPRAKKVTHRQNFRRHRSNGTGYSCKFMSKSAAHAGRRPFRRVVNGKLIRGRRKAPHVVGQGSEFLEGFAGGASGGGAAAGRGRCFKCGQAGHWEAECPLNAAAIAAQEAEMASWRTAQLEKEQERIQGQEPGVTANPAATADAGGEPVVAAGYPQHKAAAAAAAAAAQHASAAPPPPLSHAELCSIVGQAPSQPWQPEQLTDEQLRAVLKAVWGYEQFRGQQLPLIRAALQGQSMLGVLPTGLGKSLTYQLPAILLQGLVVVVSPLLALMRDQLSRLPAGLPGAMLQGSMTRQEVEQILGRAESGQLRLLYVAPEKLSAGPVLSCLRRLSPLPLVCVDEAHCMAEWGQGFRPAYFRLGHLLCNVLCPRAVLALTATATPPTRACIRQLLQVPADNQIVESPLRDNLRLRVLHCNGASKGGGIAAGVVQLLTTGELSTCRSVVVYTGTRLAADALAAQLQRAAVAARPYHAGMRQQQRELVQAAFTSGALRVVVATVAFGMGVDKQDLDAVLHTSLPHSLEEYVQQVGRAGRDGRTGHCTLFLDDADYVRLRALVHSGMARQESVETFLVKVFGREAGSDGSDGEPQAATAAGAKKKGRKKQQKLAPSQHRALPLQSTCSELDTSEEVLECCLSFLQADPVEPYLVALPNAAATIDVRFHRHTAEELAATHPVVASILAAKTRKYAGTYKVHLDALLSAADRPPGELLSELVGLATAQEVGFDLGSQGALVWRLERQPEHWQQLVDDMTVRLDQIVCASVSRLDRCYFALAGACIYSNQAAQERHLRATIDEYFMDAKGPAEQCQQQPQPETAMPAASATITEHNIVAELTGGDLVQGAMQSGEMPWGSSCPIRRPSRDSLLRQLRATVHSISRRALDLGRGKFNGLTLARMLAGLSSPGVPATVWKGCNEWATMAAVDFRLLAEVAEEVVTEFWADAK